MKNKMPPFTEVQWKYSNAKLS